MAKQAVKTAPTRGKEVARTNDSAAGLPAHLRGYESSGRGVPTDQSDFLIPMATVLDPKSPQVEKRGANYVPGAEAGDIYIKNAPVPVVKGEEGLLFQCCYRDAAVIEWLPRNRGGGGGAGFVARHPADYIANGENVEQRSHPEDKTKQIWVNATSGNPVVETRYYGGYAILDKNEPPMPLVLPFTSTGHTVAKQWNMLMAQKRINGSKADIWLCYYQVRTRLRQRGDQAWYLFDITDAGPEKNGLPTTMWCPTVEDVERGQQLYESLASGAKQMATDAGGKDVPY